MSNVTRVADWVAAQLELVEHHDVQALANLLERIGDSDPGAEIVRLGDDRVLIHAPKGRSFELVVREITGEVDRG